VIAWAEWNKGRPGPVELTKSTVDFPAARLRIAVNQDFRLYASVTRGTFKLFHGETLLTSDTGPTLRLKDGRVAVIQGEIADGASADAVTIIGDMTWAKTERMTPIRSIVLRTIMLTIGRFAPNLIRSLLQRRLVALKSKAPFSFTRTIELGSSGLRVRDEIAPHEGWSSVERIGVGGFQLPITTAMGRVWQPAQLQPWEDWTERLGALGASQPLIVERVFSEVGTQQCAA
jgi:hypothetical protein